VHQKFQNTKKKRRTKKKKALTAEEKVIVEIEYWMRARVRNNIVPEADKWEAITRAIKQLVEKELHQSPDNVTMDTAKAIKAYLGRNGTAWARIWLETPVAPSVFLLVPGFLQQIGQEDAAVYNSTVEGRIGGSPQVGAVTSGAVASSQYNSSQSAPTKPGNCRGSAHNPSSMSSSSSPVTQGLTPGPNQAATAKAPRAGFSWGTKRMTPVFVLLPLLVSGLVFPILVLKFGLAKQM